MNYSIRPLKEEEIIYVQSVNPVFGRRIGLEWCIGCWLETLTFSLKGEQCYKFPDVSIILNAMREDGCSFSSNTSISDYCKRSDKFKLCEHKGFKLSSKFGMFYGSRIDFNDYSYIVNISRNGKFLNAFLYKRNCLDSHIEQSKKGIQLLTFSDKDGFDYKIRFVINDGDKIHLSYYRGQEDEVVVRYVDDKNVYFNDKIYNICELADDWAETKTIVIPLRNSLPDMCFHYVEGSNIIVSIIKGKKNYVEVCKASLSKGLQFVQQENKNLGISNAQYSAMQMGYLFGWDTPSANPDCYDAEGKFKNNI